MYRLVQSGFTTNSPLYGSGDDFTYYDISISAVTNINKCHVYCFPRSMRYVEEDVATMYYPTARLVNSTTLRVSCAYYITSLRVRWFVVEYR